MLEEYKDWGLDLWLENARTWRMEHFETEPPLPKWTDLLREKLWKRMGPPSWYPEGWEPAPE